MIYNLLPFGKHSDSGFGLFAKTFMSAARVLEKEKKTNYAFGYEDFTICYLYRHSIELFLKSVIILLHKYFEVKISENDSSSKPLYRNTNGKIINLHNEHDLASMFHYLISLCNTYAKQINHITGTYDWPFYNMSYLSDMLLVSEYDKGSDYFRYPSSKNQLHDEEKELVKQTLNGNEFVEEYIVASNGEHLTLETYDKHGETISLYEMTGSEKIDNIREIMKKYGNDLELFHIAIRHFMFNDI